MPFIINSQVTIRDSQASDFVEELCNYLESHFAEIDCVSIITFDSLENYKHCFGWIQFSYDN